MYIYKLVNKIIEDIEDVYFKLLFYKGEIKLVKNECFNVVK